MPATCRDIVSRALRMTGIIGRSEDAEADELADGMLVLQSMYDQWLIGGMFGTLKDTYYDGDYDVEVGQRAYISDGVATLPDITDTDCRWHDLAAIEVFDTEGRKVWLWDRNAWVRLDGLEPGSDAPLSDRGVNGLAACLAILYAEEFGAQPGAGVLTQSRTFKWNLSLKLGSTQDTTAGTFF